MNDLFLVFGVFIKYAIYLFVIVFVFAIAGSFFSKLLKEPITLLKVIAVTLAPFVAAIGISYFVMYEILDLPFFVNLIAGLAIYATVFDFVDRRANVKFKDEDD